MAGIFPAIVLAHPSLVLPEAIVQQSQPSGAFQLLAGAEPQVRLGDGTLFVYVKRFQLRTRVAAGQTAYNQLPSCTIIASMSSTPTYLMRVRSEYDHHDIAAAGHWGTSLPDGMRLGMRQAIFQQARVALLTGFNPANGEGLINSPGAITVTLPADSNGDPGYLSYDNGQMALFLLAQIQATKARTYQLGQPVRVVIAGPQRMIGGWQYQGIVQVTSYQRQGGGTANIAQTVDMNVDGDTVEWVYDDTLIGQGAGGTDLCIITIPEVKKPTGPGLARDINAFSDLTPSMAANNVMYSDMAGPREIPTPLPGGAIDVLAEMRITSGWNLRPEGITLVSMSYS